MRLRSLSSVLLVLATAVAASNAPAATEYQCGAGGKPNSGTKKCDCPTGKAESTDGKGVSRCIAKPAAAPTPTPKPTVKPAPTPTVTATTTGTSKPTNTTIIVTPAPTPTPTATSAPTIAIPTATAKAGPVPTVVTTAAPPILLGCPSGMIYVSGGTYKPPHYSKVMTVVPFCMDVTEVTVKSYASCVAGKKCGEPHGKYASSANLGGANANEPFCNWNHPKGRETHPINCVDFAEADAFCVAVGKRLPFSEEWEWAARGGAKATTYPWGNTEPSPSASNLCFGECPPNYTTKYPGSSHPTSFAGADVYPETSPVGAFPMENFGFYDLGGNVSEITRSLGGFSNYARGGSFFSVQPNEVIITDEHYSNVEPMNGFRCALTPDIDDAPKKTSLPPF